MRARIFAGELPVNRCIDPVSLRLPGVHFAAQLIHRINSAVQTLTRHYTNLRFSDAWLEHLVKRARTMRVQIVHHQRDCFRRPIAFCNVIEKLCKVTRSVRLSDLFHSCSGQWLCWHKHITSPHAPLLAVNLARRCHARTGSDPRVSAINCRGDIRTAVRV